MRQAFRLAGLRVSTAIESLDGFRYERTLIIANRRLIARVAERLGRLQWNRC